MFNRCLPLFCPAAHHAAALILAVLLWSGFPTAALASGLVAFTQGEVQLRSSDGSLRPAQRGSELRVGDAVETGQGRAQLRMVDGAYLSLQPQTVLRVDEYSAAAPGVAERGFLSLLRGGLRTVTGLIGRGDRDAYRITTPTATIGIRGTEFLVTAQDEGTRVRVAGGQVAVCTSAGCLVLAPGQTGFAPPGNALPVRVAQAPSAPPAAAPPSTAFVSADERNAQGQSLAVASTGSGPVVIPTVPIPSGSGTLGAVNAGPALGFQGGLLGGTLTFDGAGALTGFTDCCSGPNFASPTVAEFNADGVIAWGRWSAGTRSGSPLVLLTYYAFRSTNPATIPITGTYNVFASTAPVKLTPSGAAVLAVGTANSVTGSLTANFPGSAGGTLTYNLTIPLGGETYSISGSASQFSTLGFLGTSSSITSTAGDCTPCTGNIPFGNAIQGGFTGTGNTRAGATYGFDATNSKITGTVVLKP
jgi:hypothetical protein